MTSYIYRVTKYNPANRSERGYYLLDDWTSISDIGKTFNGGTFDEDEYYRVEDAYVWSALSFLRESGIYQMEIAYLENYRKYSEPGFETLAEGQVYTLDALEKLFRLVLREEFWCKFGWKDSAYVHFGFDYYMYVGVNRFCPRAIAYAEQQGLFVEPFESPYLPEEPPDELDGAEVILWARTPGRPFFMMEIVDGAPDRAIPIHGFAICQYRGDVKFCIFSCDDEWNVENDSAADSVQEAQQIADSLAHQTIYWQSKHFKHFDEA